MKPNWLTVIAGGIIAALIFFQIKGCSKTDGLQADIDQQKHIIDSNAIAVKANTKIHDSVVSILQDSIQVKNKKIDSLVRANSVLLSNLQKTGSKLTDLQAQFRQRLDNQDTAGAIWSCQQLSDELDTVRAQFILLQAGTDSLQTELTDRIKYYLAVIDELQKEIADLKGAYLTEHQAAEQQTANAQKAVKEVKTESFWKKFFMYLAAAVGIFATFSHK